MRSMRELLPKDAWRSRCLHRNDWILAAIRRTFSMKHSYYNRQLSVAVPLNLHVGFMAKVILSHGFSQPMTGQGNQSHAIFA